MVPRWQFIWIILVVPTLLQQDESQRSAIPAIQGLGHHSQQNCKIKEETKAKQLNVYSYASSDQRGILFITHASDFLSISLVVLIHMFGSTGIRPGSD